MTRMTPFDLSCTHFYSAYKSENCLSSAPLSQLPSLVRETVHSSTFVTLNLPVLTSLFTLNTLSQ